MNQEDETPQHIHLLGSLPNFPRHSLLCQICHVPWEKGTGAAQFISQQASTNVNIFHRSISFFLFFLEAIVKLLYNSSCFRNEEIQNSL
jgi:hypothetical protein